MKATKLMITISLPLQICLTAIDTSALPVTGRTEEQQGVVLDWSPPSRTPALLAAWHQRNAPQLSEIESAWATLLRRLRGDQPHVFQSQCHLLSGALERLDESILLPAPDRLIDLYMRRMLRHLHGAAAACSSTELFNVVYRLEEARRALAEIRWLLEQRSVSP